MKEACFSVYVQVRSQLIYINGIVLQGTFSVQLSIYAVVGAVMNETVCMGANLKLQVAISLHFCELLY